MSLVVSRQVSQTSQSLETCTFSDMTRTPRPTIRFFSPSHRGVGEKMGVDLGRWKLGPTMTYLFWLEKMWSFQAPGTILLCLKFFMRFKHWVDQTYHFQAQFDQFVCFILLVPLIGAFVNETLGGVWLILFDIHPYTGCFQNWWLARLCTYISNYLFLPDWNHSSNVWICCIHTLVIIRWNLLTSRDEPSGQAPYMSFNAFSRLMNLETIWSDRSWVLKES